MSDSTINMIQVCDHDDIGIIGFVSKNGVCRRVEKCVANNSAWQIIRCDISYIPSSIGDAYYKHSFQLVTTDASSV